MFISHQQVIPQEAPLTSQSSSSHSSLPHPGWIFCVHCGERVTGGAPPQPQEPGPGGGEEGMDAAVQ